MTCDTFFFFCFRIRLSGIQPFNDENTQQMYKDIQNGKFSFPRQYWEGVSQEGCYYFFFLPFHSLESTAKRNLILKSQMSKNSQRSDH